jgi:hypothetical protein
VYLAFQHSPMYDKSSQVVVHQWVEEQNGTYNTYLVSLSKDIFLNEGLISQCPKVSVLPQKLVKIGYYIVNPRKGYVDFDVPLFQVVDG